MENTMTSIATEVEHEKLAMGNAKMREALLAVKELDFCKEEDCQAFYRIIDEALSTPIRNCDVGSLEDQAERSFRFCLSQNGKCKECPAYRKGKNCRLVWANLPYEGE